MIFIIENYNLQEDFVIFTAKEAKNWILFKPGYSKLINVVFYLEDAMQVLNDKQKRSIL